MDELVQRLATGEHPVILGGSQASLQEFQKRLRQIGYVFVQFTNTRGGTELGVRVDQEATDASEADFDLGKGTVHLEGTLTLNYVQVRCIADIDLTTLQGTGHLAPVEMVSP